MTGPATQVVVAGTAGGVGTTTAAALLFAELSTGAGGAPQLFDHSAGTLGLRLAEGDDASVVNPGLVLHDLGPHANGAALARLEDPETVLVLVAPATPAGVTAAEAVLGRVAKAHGPGELQRVVVACVQVFGRHRIEPALAGLRSQAGARSVVLFPQDWALAAGGRIPTVRLTARTVRAQRQLGSVLAERLPSAGKT